MRTPEGLIGRPGREHYSGVRNPLALLALLLPTACDDVCVNDDTDGRQVETTGVVDPSGTATADVPTTGTTGEPPPPPERVCGPWSTSPLAACGVVCIDKYGVDAVIACTLLGGTTWDCRLYPRVGPIVGEVYDDLPVWCGGDGKNQAALAPGGAPLSEYAAGHGGDIGWDLSPGPRQ